MSINNSSQVIIKGKATLNNVQGNQINQTFNAEVIHMNGQNMVERTEYDEFEYIKRGHVIALKKVYSEDVVEWEWRIGGPVRRDIDARKNVYIVKLHGMEGQTFTAITFEGADACTIWRKDFAHFSLDRDPGSFQLFGINQSKMPSLIFHNELVPIAQFSGKQSLWMQVYLAHLLVSASLE
ncbi:hypothetical protein MPER_11401 [Moniliophthora perniciosa FA553]|nr:hypothetical protein MPER_11401 [Moniliophthora perniciosa FA553]